MPAVIVNPRQARDFAKAIGKSAKTDAIDSAVLAHFGEAVRPEVRRIPDEVAQRFSAVLTRRRQVADMITAEKNHLGSNFRVVLEGIQAHVHWLEREPAGLHDELR